MWTILHIWFGMPPAPTTPTCLEWLKDMTQSEDRYLLRHLVLSVLILSVWWQHWERLQKLSFLGPWYCHSSERKYFLCFLSLIGQKLSSPCFGGDWEMSIFRKLVQCCVPVARPTTLQEVNNFISKHWARLPDWEDWEVATLSLEPFYWHKVPVSERKNVQRCV